MCPHSTISWSVVRRLVEQKTTNSLETRRCSNQRMLHCFCRSFKLIFATLFKYQRISHEMHFFIILTHFTKFFITAYCQITPKNISNEQQENFLMKHSSFLSNFHASSSAEMRMLLSQQPETCSTSGTAAAHTTPHHARRRVTARPCCKEGHCFQWAVCKHSIYELINCTVCTRFETLHNN